MKWIITGLILAVLLPLTLQTRKPAHAVQINNPIQVAKPQQVKTTAVQTPTVQAPSPQPVPVPVQPQPVVAPIVYHSEDFYKNYIFSHESSGRLDAVNSIGCKGLGQDCNGRLEIDCPNWRTDLNCQLAFWDRYAQARYKTWQNAYNFWVNHHWW